MKNSIYAAARMHSDCEPRKRSAGQVGVCTKRKTEMSEICAQLKTDIAGTANGVPRAVRREWDAVYSIVRLRPRLERLGELTDEKLERVSLTPFGETGALVRRVQGLVERKRKLANLAVIFDKMIEGLSEDELLLLVQAVTDSGIDGRADVNAGLGIYEIDRCRLQAIRKKCANVLRQFDVQQYWVGDKSGI